MTQNANQLFSEVQNLLTIAAKTNSYTYDSDGQRLRHTYPAGNLITNTYTARNQIASISADGPPPLATFTYDGAGNRSTNTLENGTSVEYFYNDASGMTSLIHKRSGTSFASFAYAYNSVGNRTNRTESSAGFQPATDVYTYDATDQVTSVNYNASARVVSYQWDAVGNRTTVTDNSVGTSYTANSLNQYTAVGGGSPTYDNRGNMATQNGWTYTYDAQNRLTLAEPTSPVDGNQKMLFAYDALNRCVHRQTYTRVTGNWSLITDYFLIYDGWNLIEEWTTGGAQVAHYVHGPRMDELLVKVSTTNAVYYHHDGLGNTTHLTGTNGAVVERYTYDVFGKPTILDANSQLLSASSYANRFLFTGREWLAEISLYDYRNRIYAPELGRFLQTDPIRFAAGDANISRYVLNNPVQFTDPSGLTWWDPSSWAATMNGWLQSLQNYATSQSTSTLWNWAVYNNVQIASGYVDLLNLGNGTADAANGGSLWGLAQDAARAVGLGSAVGSGVTGMFNAGANSTLYSGGYGAAYQAAMNSGRIPLGLTPGGQALNWLNNNGVTIPQSVWISASRIYSANASGPIPVYLGNPLNPGNILQTYELPMIQYWRNASPYFPLVVP